MKTRTTFSVEFDRHMPVEQGRKANFWEQKDAIALSMAAIEKCKKERPLSCWEML